MATKIERHNLQQRTMELWKQGLSTHAIAEALTLDLAGRDTITQSTVSRYLKPLRHQVQEEAREIFADHVKGELKSDLETLEAIELWHYNEFTNTDGDLKIRSEMGMRTIKIIELKLRFALGDPTAGSGVADAVDLNKFRNEVQDAPAAGSC